MFWRLFAVCVFLYTAFIVLVLTEYYVTKEKKEKNDDR